MAVLSIMKRIIVAILFFLWLGCPHFAPGMQTEAKHLSAAKPSLRFSSHRAGPASKLPFFPVSVWCGEERAPPA
jgi:hypothetical protein